MVLGLRGMTPGTARVIGRKKPHTHALFEPAGRLLSPVIRPGKWREILNFRRRRLCPAWLYRLVSAMNEPGHDFLEVAR